MAGFKTHITLSSAVGAGYGTAAYLMYGLPWPTCALAGGLCGVSGMLPDIDSDSGTPLRESVAFAAAVIPMMLIHRFQRMGMSHESMILCAAAIYLLVRFGMTWFLKRYTVHRGMFHSLPAAAVFGELAYLLASGSHELRIYKAGAVVLGYLSHLVLDEIYSVQWRHGRPRLKHSFGTAVKLFGRNGWANVSAYGKLALLTALIFFEWQGTLTPGDNGKPPTVQQSAARILHNIFHR